ncbi:P-loop containing nucleoside triphosphate hydrolase protein [Echria macrotheca]|uniref:P-loop containing nucleoside triphosphate hydrolase protein n=1 Tax=Echria macrotheca TaxID=438768 RepID=A0AAJ0B4A1_9PEZI|nr:P-loop containing nucleoside triphosphate hydrolase protein [Echria macrotheca]
MDNLLALAGTATLAGGDSGNSTYFQQFEQRIPGFGMMQMFFKTWLKVDLTTILTIAALMGAASTGAQSLQATATQAYWWIIRFLTASISIPSDDRLNKEVLNWLGAHVLPIDGTRVLAAQSEKLQDDSYRYYHRTHKRDDYHHEKRPPVQYLPTFGMTMFFHKRRLFMVRRIMSHGHGGGSWSSRTPDEYAGAPNGHEPLVVMCLGRSVEPIKRFLQRCRDFADKQRESFVTVHTTQSRYFDDTCWDSTVLRPLRSLDTVHFDEKTKQQLVDDVANYLDPNTRKFYNKRGIPYRRGYLLYGPPGTGKTSLSLALAAKFGLELYLLHMPSIQDDTSLAKHFIALPPHCIVLLEDIDAVGIKRRSSSDGSDSDDEDEDEKENNQSSRRKSECSLSGLLNVLDGVASQEGRIVLMTSNFVDKLDRALIRPGRVDQMIYLGNISRPSCEQMFCRMYSRSEGDSVLGDVAKFPEGKLGQLAADFSRQLPDEVFTPAQLQGYLLNHRGSPEGAVANVEKWAKDELETMREAKERAQRASERRKQKKRDKKLKELAKESKKDDSDDELEALIKEMLKKRKAEKAEKADQEEAPDASAEKEKDVSAEKKQVNGVKKSKAKVNGHVNGVKGETNGKTNGVVNGEANGESNGHSASDSEETEEAEGDRE